MAQRDQGNIKINITAQIIKLVKNLKEISIHGAALVLRAVSMLQKIDFLTYKLI